MNLLIDLFDHSGNAARPYRENEWSVIQVDLKHGTDILTWDYKRDISKSVDEMILARIRIKGFARSRDIRIGLLAAVPCTDYATSGAKHFARKDADGTTAKSQLLVARTKEIKDWIESIWGGLLFWKIENPRTRIHKLNPWIGSVTQMFNPCDFSGYNDFSAHNETLEWLKTQDMTKVSKHDLQIVLDANLYNKETWLFGRFNKLEVKHNDPIWKENPGWRLYGGKSERTKELRSIDPVGYCKAFYQANH